MSKKLLITEKGRDCSKCNKFKDWLSSARTNETQPGIKADAKHAARLMAKTMQLERKKLTRLSLDLVI